MDTTEGVHKPLGKYIFNNINFGKHDPMLPKLRASGYKVFTNPNDPEGVLVTFPVKWDSVQFDTFEKKISDTETITMEVNLETAIQQLERYKKYQVNWTEQNTSVTISYSPDESQGIIDWLLDNWECYVGVSFLYRADPTKSAADLGYLYLPQEVVTAEKYEEYAARLQPVDLTGTESFDEISSDGCEKTGTCPIK